MNGHGHPCSRAGVAGRYCLQLMCGGDTPNPAPARHHTAASTWLILRHPLHSREKVIPGSPTSPGLQYQRPSLYLPPRQGTWPCVEQLHPLPPTCSISSLEPAWPWGPGKSGNEPRSLGLRSQGPGTSCSPFLSLCQARCPSVRPALCRFSTWSSDPRFASPQPERNTPVQSDDQAPGEDVLGLGTGVVASSPSYGEKGDLQGTQSSGQSSSRTLSLGQSHQPQAKELWKPLRLHAAGHPALTEHPPALLSSVTVLPSRWALVP